MDTTATYPIKYILHDREILDAAFVEPGPRIPILTTVPGHGAISAIREYVRTLTDFMEEIPEIDCRLEPNAVTRMLGDAREQKLRTLIFTADEHARPDTLSYAVSEAIKMEGETATVFILYTADEHTLYDKEHKPYAFGDYVAVEDNMLLEKMEHMLSSHKRMKAR